MNIGATEIIVIVGVIILLFGASAIPKFARSIGRAKSEFKKGLREGHEENEEDDQQAEAEAAKRREAAKSETSHKP